MNIVFVILHYLTLADTVEAVESIEQFESEAQIVILDNASGNGSLEQLEEKFADDNRVDVIASPTNEGFARGNNLGIKYAREHYQADFIILANNDILLIEEIGAKVQREYDSSQFAVLGPMVYTADGRCNDNPGVDKPMSEDELQRTIRYLNRMYLVDKAHMGLVYRGLRKIKRKIFGEKEEIHRPYLNRVEDVQLHGSFLVLSQRYFEHFDGLYDGTFLNMEEDILFWQLRRENLKTVYLPSIHIYHKEDAASKKVWPSDRKRAMAKTKNCLDSARAFERLMRGNG